MSDERSVITAGQLLDARGSKVVVRSCATDLACPVYVVDGGAFATASRLEVEGEDIRISPNGKTLVAGSAKPMLATTLAVFDIATGERLDVDTDVLRFVAMPFKWSPDGDWLFGATATRGIVALNVTVGSIHRFSVPGLDRSIAGLLVRAAPVD